MNFNANGYLEPGLHDCDPTDIHENLVVAFPTSGTRAKIFDGYKQHRQELLELGLTVEQFIDGSFASTKNDPGDIDMVCFIDADAVDALDQAQQDKLVALVSGPLTKATHQCDAYFVPRLPVHHPNYGAFRTQRKYWMGEFGFDRTDQAKGMLRTIVEVKP
ncbi:DUF6932 family protein [Caulobacter sp. BE254]|uniref:DUF6932 family protein n=1 Tax=Caulobacter sp. BE254 TaxID=2817720 RepID=UPI002860049D|nr:hypothetical protein [Caulobacter sp. BE254]MDR7119015.1 hypothetical protein [Caulobacter sp. BE254]